MSQNKVPSSLSAKPLSYPIPTRNMSPSMFPGESQGTKVFFLYLNITQLRQIYPGASYKRKTGIETRVFPKTNEQGCNPIAAGEGGYAN